MKFALCLAIILPIISFWIRVSPFIERPFTPSHFRMNIFSAINLAFSSGHIPTSEQTKGIMTFKTALLDEWARITTNVVIWNILGARSIDEKYLLLRFLILPPMILLSGLVLILKMYSSSIYSKLFVYLSGLFACQLYISNTVAGLHGWGYAAGFFVLMIASLLRLNNGGDNTWAIFAVLFGSLIPLWRHTFGLIILLTMLSSILTCLLFQIQIDKRIKIIFILLPTIYVLNSGILHEFLIRGAMNAVLYVTALVSGVTTLKDTSSGGGVVPAAGKYNITISKVLSISDRILIFLIGLIIFLSILKTYLLYKQNTGSSSVASDSLFIGSLYPGLVFAMIVFFIYRGLSSVIWRMGLYGSVFLLFSIPVFLLLSDNTDIIGQNTRRVVIVLLCVLVIVSPAAYISSDVSEGHSGWLTHEEDIGSKFLMTYSDDRLVFGSYHLAPPLLLKKDNVVSFGYDTYTRNEFNSTLNGIYYEPSTNNTKTAMEIIDSKRDKNVELIVLSTRESDKVGVNSRAQKHAPASDNYVSKYDGIVYVNQVYNNGQYYALDVS